MREFVKAVINQIAFHYNDEGGGAKNYYYFFFKVT